MTAEGGADGRGRGVGGGSEPVSYASQFELGTNFQNNK